MSRNSDLRLYVNLLTLLNSTYNLKSLSRDITIIISKFTPPYNVYMYIGIILQQYIE